MQESTPTRILIADGDRLFREGLKALFSRHDDLRVVGLASDGNEACAKARRYEPDIVLLESQLAGMNGAATARQILADLPHTRVTMLSESQDEEDMLSAIKAGAHGYITKDVSVGALLDGVRRVSNGDGLIPPALASRLLSQYAEMSRGQENEAKTYDARVTSRERDILRLLVDGATNRDISQRLGIAENTVKVHLRNILEKLQLRNRQQAAAFAVSSGLVRLWKGQPDASASRPVLRPSDVGRVGSAPASVRARSA